MPKTDEQKKEAKSISNKNYQMKLADQKISAQKAQTEAENAKKNALLLDENLLRTDLKKRLRKHPLDGNGQMTKKLVEAVADSYCDHHTTEYNNGEPDLSTARAKVEALFVHLSAANLRNSQTKDKAYDDATQLFGDVSQIYADTAVNQLVVAPGWLKEDLEQKLKVIELSSAIVHSAKAIGIKIETPQLDGPDNSDLGFIVVSCFGANPKTLDELKFLNRLIKYRLEYDFNDEFKETKMLLVLATEIRNKLQRSNRKRPASDQSQQIGVAYDSNDDEGDVQV